MQIMFCLSHGMHSVGRLSRAGLVAGSMQRSGIRVAPLWQLHCAQDVGPIQEDTLHLKQQEEGGWKGPPTPRWLYPYFPLNSTLST